MAKTSNHADDLFICFMATGIAYADRSQEVGGDYKRLAFLPYSTCRLEIAADCPADFREMIEADALNYHVGKTVQTTTSSQTVVMGYQRIAAGEPLEFFGNPSDTWEAVQAAQHSPFLYVIANGSPWRRDPRLERLYDALRDYRLDIDRFGHFWTVDPRMTAQGPRLFEASGVVHFVGNFKDYSHVFIIYTNHAATIASLQAAIQANLARQGREV